VGVATLDRLPYPSRKPLYTQYIVNLKMPSLIIVKVGWLLWISSLYYLSKLRYWYMDVATLNRLQHPSRHPFISQILWMWKCNIWICSKLGKCCKFQLHKPFWSRENDLTITAFNYKRFWASVDHCAAARISQHSSNGSTQISVKNKCLTYTYAKLELSHFWKIEESTYNDRRKYW
jgi:hypothetical protein